MENLIACCRCGEPAKNPAWCAHCGCDPVSLRKKAPTSLARTRRGRLGGRATPVVARRRLCGRCGLLLGDAERCGGCGAEAEGAIEGQNHQGGAMWARVEILVRCGCGGGVWQKLPSLGEGVGCQACGRVAGLGEAQTRALVRLAHGAADMGGGGEGLHGLRWLPLGERNPHRGLGVSGGLASIDEIAFAAAVRRRGDPHHPGGGPGDEGLPDDLLQVQLRLALGHPLCPHCRGRLRAARRVPMRVVPAGMLQCSGCRALVPSSLRMPSLLGFAPLRAVIEEGIEARESEHYRDAGGSSVAAWWMCFEGPSRERMDLERTLLDEREREQALRRSKAGQSSVFPGLIMSALGVAVGLAPFLGQVHLRRWVGVRQATELKLVAVMLAVVAVSVGVSAVLAARKR